MKCPRCNNNAGKNGTSHRYGKIEQKYRCLHCGHHFSISKEQNNNFSLSNNGTDLSGQAQTLDELLAKANVDLSVWEVESFEIKDNTYEVSSKEREQDLKWIVPKDDNGNPTAQFMEGSAKRGDWQTKQNKQFFIKVKLRRKNNIFDAEKFRRELVDSIKPLSPIVPTMAPIKYGECCMEVNIFDLHLGKLAWGQETGENYDSKIAQERFFDAIKYLANMATMFKIEEILFPIGNDFFNSDSDYPYPMTTAGTPMENDLRWQKLFKTGREMLIKAIDFLSSIARVHIVVISGNHDLQKMFYMGDVLECKYENNNNVTVDNTPRTRKYYRYGNNLIGFTHKTGKETPEQRLLLLMPQEQPQLWAETKYREWHCGDIHHKRTFSTASEEDHQGITIRYMRTLKGTDSWEYQKGFIGSVGGAEAYIWHKETGLVSIFNYNL